jgi:PAS domain S-box-containing protein
VYRLMPHRTVAARYALAFGLVAAALLLASVVLLVPRLGSFRLNGTVVIIAAVAAVLLLAIVAERLARRHMAVERASEAHYRAMTEQSPDALLVVAEGRFVFANPAAARLLGADDPADVIGHTPDEVVDPAHRDGLDERMRAVTERNLPMPPVEFRGRRLDGEIVDLEARVGPFSWEGRRAALVSMHRITRPKRTQEEVRYRAEQFETLLDAAPVAVYMIDADFRIAQVNPLAMQAFARRTGGDVIGRDFAELLRVAWPRSLAEAAERMFRHTLETGEPFHMPEFRERRADGDGTEYYDWRINRITLPDGRYGVVCYVIDVTHRKRAADALQESEARLRIAKSAARLGLHDFDVQANCVTWDERTREIWGVDADEPITYEVWRESLHPDDVAEADAAVGRALDPAGDGRFLAQYRVTNRKDGITRWVEATGQTTFVHGQPVRLVGTTRDISEQKQTEEILREDDRRKDEFIATLAHELRNPLAAIRMGLRVLESASGDGEQRTRMHAIIDRQSAQLVRLIDDLLDVSRITRGKMNLQKERVDLARTLDHVVDAARDLCDGKGVHLTVVPPVEPTVIEADAFRFAQVLMNLLGNACKFTDAGGTITISVENDGDSAVVRVRDTGVGIPPEQLSRIFEMFTQVAAGRGEGGLGIGLSLARLIVELHGGSIEAHSAGPGMGSEFVVRVPLAVPEPAGQVAARIETGASAGADAGPRRILAVDDNVDAVQALAVILQAAGHAVETAEDGESGAAKALAMRPEVVLLDIGLPDIDGYEVARRIRSASWGRDVLLVAITGWGRAADKRRASEAGFDAHLTKPVEPEALQRLIATYARRPDARTACAGGAEPGHPPAA